MAPNISKKQKTPRQNRAPKNSPLKHIGHGTKQEKEALLETIPDAFMSLDRQWQLTYVNHHAEALFGKTREDLLGKSICDIDVLPTDSLFNRVLREAIDQQRNYETTIYHPQLNTWFAVRVYPFHDGLFAFFHPISQPKPGEELLQLHQVVPDEKSVEVPQRNLVATDFDISKSIIVTNLQGKIIYWNKGASNLFGYSAKEMMGKTPALLYPEMAQTQLAADLQNILNGKDYRGLWKGRRKNSSSILVEITTTVLRNNKGKPIGFIGIARESSKHEYQLEEVENLYYAQIAQRSLDAVIATDINYTILSWNETAVRLYGWKAEEARGKPIDAILPTNYFDTSRNEANQQLLSHGFWKGEVIQTRKDGARLLILASVTLIKDAAGKILGAVAANRDITDLRGLPN